MEVAPAAAGIHGCLCHEATASYLLGLHWGGKRRNVSIFMPMYRKVSSKSHRRIVNLHNSSLPMENLHEKFEEFGNEEWRRKRIGWLCKELPVQRASGIVKILKKQKKWVGGREINYIVHHLLRCAHLTQAYHVYKWWERQIGYEPDFEMLTSLANTLAMRGRMLAAREIFISMICSGHVPDASTFSALVTGYSLEGVEQSLDDAWKIYLQMKQIGGYEPSRALKFRLFKALLKACSKSLKFLNYADTLFTSCLDSGLRCGIEMFESLLHFHALKGNEEKVEYILKQLKAAEIDTSPGIYKALLTICAKTGNHRRAEHAFRELKKIVDVPDWRSYVSLIRAYAKAGYYSRALNAFNEIERLSINVNPELYVATIEVMAEAGDSQSAEQLLDKLSQRSYPSSQSAFNSVMDIYIRKGLYAKVETLFDEMELSNCRPNRDSLNLLILSYLKNGSLSKAEEIYGKMQGNGSVRRNLRTYSLMLEAYRRAENYEKVLEVSTELASRNLVKQFEANYFPVSHIEQIAAL